MEGSLTMSPKERQILIVLQQHLRGALTVEEAACALEITERQFYRIKRRFADDGDAGLVHRARGRPSNVAYSPMFKAMVLDLYRRKYPDYGPTLFAERLEYHEGHRIDHETLRRWLHHGGLMPQVRRGRKHRMRRPRQPHVGALVQLDGSVHDWFEARAPRCTLLVFVDDASNITFMRFACSENTREVLSALRAYIERYGIPTAFYTDRGTAFYNSSKTPDFVRALTVLGSKVIYAGSPQAKGRVERANRTHQDRLVKILREQNICSIDAANDFLEREYLAEHNARFAMPEGLEDIHRPAKTFDLDNILCLESLRCVHHDMTIQFQGTFLQILASPGHLPLPKQYLTVRTWLDGSVHLFWREIELQWRYAPDQTSRRKTRELGKADTFAHPWYNKPVGASKNTRGRNRCR